MENKDYKLKLPELQKPSWSKKQEVTPESQHVETERAPCAQNEEVPEEL